MRERLPLDEAALRLLLRPGGLWQDIRVVAETGSSNADLLAAAAGGAAEGLVLVAEAQTAGRGRLGRAWVSPPRASLTFSMLLRPAAVPPSRRSWMPLLAGVAVASALRGQAAVFARLKWPNDVLVGAAKVAGILAEATGDDAIVVGVGINVSLRRTELPVPTATSLLLVGASGVGASGVGVSGVGVSGVGVSGEGVSGLDRGRLLGAVLNEFARWYAAWTAAVPAGDPDSSGLRAEYLRQCATIGRQVRAELPGGQTAAGLAADVDDTGRLVLRTPAGQVAVSAGDVVHLR